MKICCTSRFNIRQLYISEYGVLILLSTLTENFEREMKAAIKRQLGQRRLLHLAFNTRLLYMEDVDSRSRAK